METTFQFEYFGVSDIGHVRKANEDVWFAAEDFNLYLLADGMGGRPGGKQAAELAVKRFHAFLKENLKRNSTTEEAFSIMQEAFNRANQDVFEIGQTTTELFGMGTTLNALLLLPQDAIIGHVGDSRIYCLRENHLLQLTEDHTVANERGSEKNKHILSRAIGAAPYVSATLDLFSLNKGDLFLLCSDGLTNSISDEVIQKIMQSKKPLQNVGEQLLNTALQCGGKDNITLVLVQAQ